VARPRWDLTLATYVAVVPPSHLKGPLLLAGPGRELHSVMAFSMFIIAVIVLIASKPPAKHSFLRIVAQGTPGTGVVGSGSPSPDALSSESAPRP
jgi:hypothetical protein